jgi:uroporphyrinogen decarboxylase
MMKLNFLKDGGILMFANVKVDQMTPKERMDAFKQGQEIDRIPCGLCPGDYLYKLTGDSVSDLYFSVKHMVESQQQARKIYELQFAGTGPIINGIAEAIGSKVVYPKQESPYITEYVVKEYDDLKKLEIPDPYKCERLAVILNALEQLQECLGNELPVISEVAGPLTTACNLRGMERLMLDLYENPDFVRELVDFSLKSTMAYIIEASKLGVTFCISDPVSSLMGEALFRNFEFSYLKDLVQSITSLTGDAPMLHICGYTENLWNDMADTGASIVSLDQEVDLEVAKKAVGHKVTLYGNINPIQSMLYGTAADVENDARNCMLKAYNNPKGFILGLGCGMPIDAPAENIHAFIAAARKYGQYPLEPKNFT